MEIKENLIKRVRRRLCNSLSFHIASFLPSLLSSGEKPYVFLIGCPRSGTTMLNTLIGMHKDVASYSEANEVWDKYIRFDRPHWVDWHHDLERWVKFKTNRMKNEIKTTFELTKRLQNKKIFLNKCPKNTLRLHLISEMFPNALYIYIIRDGRAVVNSIINRNVSKNNVSKGYNIPIEDLYNRLSEFWVLNIQEVKKQRNSLHLNNDRFYEIQYEKFCEEPKKYLEEIFQFLTINPKRYQYNILNKIKSQNYKFTETIDSKHLLIINEIMHSELLEFNYSI